MEAVLCAVIGGLASLFGVIMKKTSRRATIVLCLVGFVFISIGAILFIMDYGDTGGGIVEKSPSPTYSVEIGPSPTYSVEPSPSISPSDKVTILGVELPAVPGEETVDEYGPGLHYPEKSEYLDDYQIKYIDAPKGQGIFCYSAHGSTKVNLGVILQDEPVILFAKNINNGFSCVINPEEKEAVWVNTLYLANEPD